MAKGPSISERVNEQYRAMSGTGRFAMVVLALVVLLLVWSNVFMPWANASGEKADAIEDSNRDDRRRRRRPTGHA